LLRPKELFAGIAEERSDFAISADCWVRTSMAPSDRSTIDDIEARASAYPAPGLMTALCNGLFFVSLALVFFLRRPFLILVVLHMALPWIVLVLAACLPDNPAPPVPKKGTPAAVLRFSLLLIALSSLSVFDTTKPVSLQRAVYLGCVPGALFFVAVILLQKRGRAGTSGTTVIVMLLFSAVYGYGLVRELNIELDRSPGTVYPAVVLGKSSYKGGYSLRFAPWDFPNGAETIHVPYSLYHSIHVRERVCMVVKEGALGMSWYSAQACPWNGKIEFP
jgi:hypothetical protein